MFKDKKEKQELTLEKEEKIVDGVLKETTYWIRFKDSWRSSIFLSPEQYKCLKELILKDNK